MRAKKKIAMLDRERADWKRWCQAAEAERDRLLDGMEIAWGVIANANGGNWDGETPEWQAAAERWRDEQWHPALDRLVPISAEAGDTDG
jgi:hypothetical protein